ncbi:urease accessory protein [Pseudomonas pohangensis]|uniref:Urease accessory protein n=1 Tax=Pseudomonas pohangensis TaxID=364197 RepID=A0A1H2E265_9PSED|nr:HupE/UreJ family protein [Pseudomonas pohangensis]SDT89119.1 urease accessory protein [Pseudomonas pohangensis]
MTRRQIFATLALLFSPALAMAHPGHDATGLLAGLGHPLAGLDHLLAMLAVGLWAAQQQGAACRALPLTFVGSMLAGAVLGYSGIALPGTESAIAASVMAFSLLVVVAARLPLAVAVSLTAAFALFHGVAHIQELPANGSVASYASGFLLATAGLQALGFALLRWLPAAAAPWLRASAGISAAAGGWLLLG